MQAVKQAFKKRIFAVLAAVVALCVFAPVASAANQAITDARSGVVRIAAVQSSGRILWIGSAFAVGKKGTAPQYFITCDHCVTAESGEPQPDGIVILLKNTKDSDSIVNTSVVYSTRGSKTGPDFAVLKAERPVDERKPLAILTKDHVSVTDEVYALGFPAAADPNSEDLPSTVDDVSITRGVISKLSVEGVGNWSDNYQTDAAINSGNSGGPLVSASGSVIGIDSFQRLSSDGNGATGINGAVYIDKVLPVLQQNNIAYDLDNGGGASGSSSGASASSAAVSSSSAVTSSSASSSSAVASSSSAASGKAAGGGNGVNTLLIVIAAVVVVGGLVTVIIVLATKNGKKPAPSAAPVVPPVVPSAQPVTVGAPPVRPMPPKRPLMQGVGANCMGRQVELTDGKVVIGRDPARCNYIFDAATPGVSGVHCEISFNGSAFVLRDLGSTYGTFLANGVRLIPMQEQLLPSGSSFYLGGLENSFELILN